MSSLRKVILFIIAASLGAFALPAAGNGGGPGWGEKYRLDMPGAPVSSGTEFSVTITNKAPWDYLRSFTLTAPAGVLITSVLSGSSSVPQSKITAPNPATAGGTISVSGIQIPYGSTGTLKIKATFPTSCTTQTLAWASTAKGGFFVNYEVFDLENGPSKTTVAGGPCKYSLTGDSSVVAGASSSVAMTLKNNATAGGPTITSLTLTAPAGVTITSPAGGVVSGLTLAPGASTLVNVTVSTPPNCTGTAAATWSSSVVPANFAIDPAGSNPKTTITAQACSLSLATTPTSAVKGTPFSQDVALTGGTGTASVTLAASGANCPALTGTLTKAAVGGAVTFDALSFASTGSCTLTATATNYVNATKPFDIFAASGLACNQSNFPTSVSPGYGPLDPNADQAFGGNSIVDWGLRRGDNVGGNCGADMNYTLTISDDGKISNLLVDKGNPPQAGNFKYVIVWQPQPFPADGWPTLRPDVAWVVIAGVPQWVPGLGCLGDDLADGTAVMPTIPDVPPFTGNPNYMPGTKAKMCIAQVGWTPFPPVGSGQIQFWTKVIDQSDGLIRQP